MKIPTTLHVPLPNEIRWLLTLSWLIMFILLLSGCVHIKKPENQKSLSTPELKAEVILPANYRDGSFVAYLDEKDITSKFEIIDRYATATLDKPNPGMHSLKVSACWEWGVLFVMPFPISNCANARSDFSVPRPPSPPPRTATINVSVTAPGCINKPPIKVTISNPNGISPQVEIGLFNNCTANVVFANLTANSWNIDIRSQAPSSGNDNAYHLTCQRYLNAGQTLNVTANTVQNTINCLP